MKTIFFLGFFVSHGIIKAVLVRALDEADILSTSHVSVGHGIELEREGGTILTIISSSLLLWASEAAFQTLSASGEG